MCHIYSNACSKQMLGWIDGGMDDLQFYILFNSISIISGGQMIRKAVCNGTPFMVEEISLEQGWNSGPLDQ